MPMRINARPCSFEDEFGRKVLSFVLFDPDNRSIDAAASTLAECDQAFARMIETLPTDRNWVVSVVWVGQDRPPYGFKKANETGRFFYELRKQEAA